MESHSAAGFVIATMRPSVDDRADKLELSANIVSRAEADSILDAMSTDERGRSFAYQVRLPIDCHDVLVEMVAHYQQLIHALERGQHGCHCAI